MAQESPMGEDDQSVKSDEEIIVETNHDFSADDALISTMITAARITAENYMSRDIVAKTRTYYLPSQ